MRFFLLPAFCLFASLNFAQEGAVLDSDEYMDQPDSAWSFGIKAGLGVSSLDKDNSVGNGDLSRIGFNGGFFTTYDMSERSTLRIELQYAAMGSKPQNLRANYLLLPVLYQFNIADHFAIHAGPEVGVKIWEFQDNFYNFDYLGVAGFTIDLGQRFGLQAQYHWGFRNVIDEDRPALNAHPDSWNKAVYLALTYTL